MARPTKYTKEILKKAREYLGSYLGLDEEALQKKIESGGIPSVVGLALHLNIAKSTLYDWASDENKEFSDTLETVNNLQEQLLVSGGLVGRFNPTITKLMLHNHGHSDKQEVEANGNLIINVNR